MLIRLFRFFRAIFRHLLNKGKNADFDEYSRRIEMCNKCEKRSGMECSICECLLTEKAWWASEKCPLKKWEN